MKIGDRPRQVGVVTVARSDYGIYRPLLEAIDARPELELKLIVAGMHLRAEDGLFVEQIEADRRPIAARVPIALNGDRALDIACATGEAVAGFAQALAAVELDWLIVLGDRYEMFAAALAALPFNLPLGHIHGGELTIGAFDDALRHAMTKLAHLHFVSTASYGQRVRQMGEAAERVINCGALSVDCVTRETIISREQLANELGFALPERFLLATFHPTTRATAQLDQQLTALIGALSDADLPVIFTAPNADTAGRDARQAIEVACRANPAWHFVENMGTRRYFAAMNYAAAMVGNSSSGIVEAGLFRLPVVNVGIRQQGRLRHAGIIDVADDRQAIVEAIEQATSAAFAERWRDFQHPYGDGHAAQRIAEALVSTAIDDKLLQKAFCDLT
ncbi:MAG: UDP-N-acetylglucosamine 2-epimerase (hydrolyzing) [Deltaproteobacteria bacterium]|nr:UDP-N-acetylglucosamine 2-epimerase (hydrolyzing) [Deltaproteobacteria bacterium]